MSNSIQLSPLFTQEIPLISQGDAINRPLLEVVLKNLPVEDLLACSQINKHLHGVIQKNHLLQAEIIVQRMKRQVLKFEEREDRIDGYLYLSDYDSFEESLAQAKEEATKIEEEEEWNGVWTRIVEHEAPHDLLSAIASLGHIQDPVDQEEGYLELLKEILKRDVDPFEQAYFIWQRFVDRNLISQAAKKILKRSISLHGDFPFQNWLHTYPHILDPLDTGSIFTLLGDKTRKVEYLNTAEYCLQIAADSSRQWNLWIKAMAKFDWDRAFDRISSVATPKEKLSALLHLFSISPTEEHYAKLKQVAITLPLPLQIRFWTFVGSLVEGTNQEGFFAYARGLISLLEAPETQANLALYLFQYTSRQEDLDSAKNYCSTIQSPDVRDSTLLSIASYDPSSYEEARPILTRLDDSLESFLILYRHLNFHQEMNLRPPRKIDQ